MFKPHWLSLPRVLRAPEDGAGAAAVTPPAGEGVPAAGEGAAQPAGANAAPAKSPWYADAGYTEEDRQWLTARGLTEDDVTKVVPKLVRGHRNAEARLGRGVDTILDKPAKDQPISDWMRANAAALGLPDKPEGYEVKPPEFWPKDLPWDSALEAKARDIAFKAGAHPEVHKQYVALCAEKMKAMEYASREGLATAQAEMMAELRRDYGAQTDAKITQARQAAQAIGEKAGLTTDQIAAIGQTLSDKLGDAGVIRFLATAAEAFGEDSAAAIGRGGQLTTTPAEARAELAAITAADGPMQKAMAAQDRTGIAELNARRVMLAKIAAATK